MNRALVRLLLRQLGRPIRRLTFALVLVGLLAAAYRLVCRFDPMPGLQRDVEEIFR